MQDRGELERKGYTFHAGHLHAKNGRYILDEYPDSTPPMIDDLEAGGYMRVPGGIMEPPTSEKLKNGVIGLGILALIGVGIHLLTGK